MTQKSIGPTFAAELKAAGLMGLPFSWSSDGEFAFDEAMTEDQITAVEAVYAAHDPDAGKNAAETTAQAQALLDKTDMVALRCLKAGVAFPSAWQSVTQALRGIVANGTLPSGGMPTLPAYPAGT